MTALTVNLHSRAWSKLFILRILLASDWTQKEPFQALWAMGNMPVREIQHPWLAIKFWCNCMISESPRLTHPCWDRCWGRWRFTSSSWPFRRIRTSSIPNTRDCAPRSKCHHRLLSLNRVHCHSSGWPAEYQHLTILQGQTCVVSIYITFIGMICR